MVAFIFILNYLIIDNKFPVRVGLCQRLSNHVMYIKVPAPRPISPEKKSSELCAVNPQCFSTPPIERLLKEYYPQRLHIFLIMGKKSKSQSKSDSKAETKAPAAGLPFLGASSGLDPSLSSLFEKSVCFRVSYCGGNCANFIIV